MAASSSLTITIVGGGIAGFAAALALRRAGHNVHIYERSALNDEVGAAISVPPNATRILLAWGFDTIRAKLVTMKCKIHARGDTLELLHGVEYESSTLEKYGAPWFFAHRVDLHEELKKLATGPDGAGVPVTLHLKAEMIECNPEVPSITLSNGEVVSSDVVIGADGIHSTAVNAILGKPNPPQHPTDVYNFCYRFLIQAKDIEADTETKFWNQDIGYMKSLIGKMKRIVSYPCRNNEVHNFVALFHNDNISTLEKEDWHASVDKSSLLERFLDFHPSIQRVLDKATDIKQWPLLFRPPISPWTKDRMALVGDAVHPMLPLQGQGGAQSIEDGVVLGLVLCGATHDNIPERLKLYENIRRNRASIMQIFSNAGQDEAELMHKEASKYMPLERIPKKPQEFHEFNFGYDAIRDTLDQLKDLDPAFELPDSFFQKEPAKGTYVKFT